MTEYIGGILHCLLLRFLLVWACCWPRASSAQQKSYEESRQELELFDRMTETYDARIRPPTQAGTPVAVKIDLFLRNLGAVDDVRMEFTTDILIRQTWNDSRLGFIASRITGDFISLTPALAERIWKPDLFFSLERQSSYHELLMPNRMLRLYAGGKILYSARITITTHCHMSLSNYPFDIQKGFFAKGKQVTLVQSKPKTTVSYTDRDVRYEWRDQNAFIMREGIQGTQFVLTDMKPISCVNSHYTGNYSCLTVQFLFERQYGYHLVQIYVPTTLLVIVSWASFFLDVDATPARVTLGVTTLLTVSTQTTGIRSSLPPVSYTKAIDVWLSVCTALIFLALLEFAMVNLISRKGERRLPRTQTAAAFAALGRYLFRENENKEQNASMTRNENDDNGPSIRFRTLDNVRRRSLATAETANTVQDNEACRRGLLAEPSGGDAGPIRHSADQSSSALKDDAQRINNNALLSQQHGSRRESAVSVVIDYKARAKLIDVACRVIFPALFAAFNVVYWVTYFFILTR